MAQQARHSVAREHPISGEPVSKLQLLHSDQLAGSDSRFLPRACKTGVSQKFLTSTLAVVSTWEVNHQMGDLASV